MTAETTTEIPSREEVRQYLAQGYWDESITIDCVYRHAQATPEREALVDSNWRLSFAETVKSMQRLALKFHQAGIQSGDRVGRQLPVCVDGQIVDLALSAIGAIYMTLPLQSRGAEWAHLLNATDAVAMIIPAQHGGFDFVAMAQSVKASHPSVKHIFVHNGGAPPATIALEAAFHENLESKY